jgi:hypothetical protein
MRIGSGLSLVLAVTTGLFGQARSVGIVAAPGGTGLPGITRTLGSVVNPAQGGLVVPGTGRGVNFGYGYGYGRGVNGSSGFIGGYYSAPYISSQPFIGGPDDYYGSAPPQSSPSNVTVVMPPQQQPVTPVVINYNYGAMPPPAPGAPMDRAPAASQDDDSGAEPAHYLIAFKDHTIYAATAYWVDGDTIHYFTAGNVHNQASLALVDRDFTLRLNKEAGVDVKLPVPAK